MNHGAYLGNWTDPLVHEKWQWWRSPLENRLYKHNGDDWLMYVKRYWWRYYYSNPVPSIPTASAIPVSIGIDAGSCRIEAEVTSFIVCPTSNLVSDFVDASV